MVRPAGTAQVAAVLAELNRAGQPVVPQGGNTGLVGGGVPLHGEVVVSLRRLDTVGEVDRLASQVTAGAGVPLAALDAAAAGSGLAFGVDLAARDSATLGGMVATNAGGLRMLRYGGMRAQVAGIEAVLASGSVVSHLAGLTKDNTGYDLGGLLAGSRGHARHRHPRCGCGWSPASPPGPSPFSASPPPRRPSRSSPISAGACPARWRRPSCSSPTGSSWCADTSGSPARSPTRWESYLLVEVAGAHDPTDDLAGAVAECTAGESADSAVESDTGGRARLWRYREAHTEAINAAGVPVKLDIALPSAELAGFVPRVREELAVAVPGARPVLFGHAADGNLHVNVLEADTPDRAAAAEDTVLRLVAGLGGKHQRRARHRHGQTAVAAPEPHPRGDRRLPGAQGRPRPARHTQSPRAAA